MLLGQHYDTMMGHGPQPDNQPMWRPRIQQSSRCQNMTWILPWTSRCECDAAIIIQSIRRGSNRGSPIVTLALEGIDSPHTLLAGIHWLTVRILSFFLWQTDSGLTKTLPWAVHHGGALWPVVYACTPFYDDERHGRRRIPHCHRFLTWHCTCKIWFTSSGLTKTGSF